MGNHPTQRVSHQRMIQTHLILKALDEKILFYISSLFFHKESLPIHLTLYVHYIVYEHI